jgi:hypothetical protein
MTKYFVLLVASTLCFYTIKAQHNRIPDILQVTWILEKEQMSGVGNHQSLPEKTTLVISPDYSWTASAPIGGRREGRWYETGKKSLVIKLADGKTADVQVLDDGRLMLSQTTGFSKTKIFWKRH